MRVAQIPNGRQARIGSRELSTGSRNSEKKLLCNKQSKLKGSGNKSSTGDIKRRKSDGQQIINSVPAVKNRNMIDLSEAQQEYNDENLNDA